MGLHNIWMQNFYLTNYNYNEQSASKMEWKGVEHGELWGERGYGWNGKVWSMEEVRDE